MRVRPAKRARLHPANGQPPTDRQPRTRLDRDVHVSGACLIPTAGPRAAAPRAPRERRRCGAPGAGSSGDPQHEGNP